jgi:hypothetical protein
MYPLEWRMHARLPHRKQARHRSFVLQLWQMYQLLISVLSILLIFLSFNINFDTSISHFIWKSSKLSPISYFLFKDSKALTIQKSLNDPEKS